MNVRRLIQLLNDVDPELEILVSEDPEGNGFRRLAEYSVSYIYLNDDKHGYVESVYDENDLSDDPDDYDTVPRSEVEPRLVLWP